MFHVRFAMTSRNLALTPPTHPIRLSHPFLHCCLSLLLMFRKVKGMVVVDVSAKFDDAFDAQWHTMPLHYRYVADPLQSCVPFFSCVALTSHCLLIFSRLLVHISSSSLSLSLSLGHASAIRRHHFYHSRLAPKLFGWPRKPLHRN
jgi:hypothetical protein